MSEEQTVTYELEGGIALVGLNRPDKRNCFNPTVMKQLRDAIERAGDEAKCGIIFGHGDNFCAGLDLRWAAENWQNGRSHRRRWLGSCSAASRLCPHAGLDAHRPRAQAR